jgi:hypothetical protein
MIYKYKIMEIKNLLRITKNVIIPVACIILAASCGKDKDKDDDTPDKSTVCDIVSFTVDGLAWEINGTDISFTYSAETVIMPLAPVITLSPGATVNPPSGEPQNLFADAGITYTVTAADGVTAKNYTARAILNLQTVDSGVTGECTWTLAGVSGNCTLTVSGNGAMADYYSVYEPWYGYHDNIRRVVIREGVTAIGSYAFYQCYYLTEVTIPNSVITVGNGAFAGCSDLTTVTGGNSVEIIGNDVFSGCRLTGTLIIPNSVTSIGSYAFYGCTGLATLTIGNAVKTIGEGAFKDFDGLTAVTVGNAVETIGSRAFYNCTGLTTVTIGNSVETIGNEAFRECHGLITVTNLNPVPQNISDYVFYYASQRCTLKVPASAVEAYRAAPVWSNFRTIVAIE